MASVTIILTWINPDEILRDYLSGKFDNIQTPTERVHTSIVRASNEIYDGDYTKKRFNIRSQHGSNIVVIAWSSIIYAMENEVPCGYCRKTLQPGFHDGVVMNIRSVEKAIKLEPRGYTHVSEKQVEIDHPHCNMNCTLASVLKNPTDYPRDAARNIRYYHRLCFPNAGVLEPSDDYRLLDTNGGPLTHTEYINGKNCRYREVHGITRLPTRRCIYKN
jgi:hypothetical protein